MTTIQQYHAIHFCEKVLSIKFDGDKNSEREIDGFLRDYLDIAKYEYRRLAAEYDTYIKDFHLSNKEIDL